SRFQELKFIYDKIVAQARQLRSARGKLDVWKRTLKKSLVCQDGKRCGTRALQVASQLLWIKVRPNQTARRRSFLQLGNDRHGFAALLLQRPPTASRDVLCSPPFQFA